MSESQAERVFEFWPHWVMRIAPAPLALAGVAPGSCATTSAASRRTGVEP